MSNFTVTTHCNYRFPLWYLYSYCSFCFINENDNKDSKHHGKVMTHRSTSMHTYSSIMKCNKAWTIQHALGKYTRYVSLTNDISTWILHEVRKVFVPLEHPRLTLTQTWFFIKQLFYWSKIIINLYFLTLVNKKCIKKIWRCLYWQSVLSLLNGWMKEEGKMRLIQNYC